MMLDEKKSALHFGTRSLLPLTLALIAAEKESPARAPQQIKNADEELAYQLIESMRREFKISHPFAERHWVEKAIATS